MKKSIKVICISNKGFENKLTFKKGYEVKCTYREYFNSKCYRIEADDKSKGDYPKDRFFVYKIPLTWKLIDFINCVPGRIIDRMIFK